MKLSDAARQHIRYAFRAASRLSNESLGGSSSRVSVEGVPRDLKYGDRVFAADIGKVREKRIQWITGLEVVNQRLHGNARAGEHGSATEAPRRTGDEGTRHGHDRARLKTLETYDASRTVSVVRRRPSADMVRHLPDLTADRRAAVQFLRLVAFRDTANERTEVVSTTRRAGVTITVPLCTAIRSLIRSIAAAPSTSCPL